MRKLIVIEGLDGSGKATQTKLLTDWFKKKRLDVRQISFPDYESPSSALVKLYLGGAFGKSPDDVNAYAASSFYAVDRYASYKQFWEKDYLSGKIIIADRYTTSNAIYQLSKVETENRDGFLEWLEFYEYRQLQLPVPDLTVYLDMPIEISQGLLVRRYNGDAGKKDLHESNFSFLKQCRESALYSAEKYGWHIINCSENGKAMSIQAIHNAVLDEVKKKFFTDYD